MPRKILRLSGQRIQEFAAGPFHTLALNENGELLAFGNGNDGKLGILSNLKDIEAPTRIEGPNFYKITNSTDFMSAYKIFKGLTDNWTCDDYES